MPVTSITAEEYDFMSFMIGDLHCQLYRKCFHEKGRRNYDCDAKPVSSV